MKGDESNSRVYNPQWEKYLRPTPTMDFGSDSVQAFIRDNCSAKDPVEEQVISLYYAVRDQVRYDPYTHCEQPEDYSASQTLQRRRAWCIPKSLLYAACCRALGVPARLGYADVRNHLSTENLRRMMGTDVFYWHGYTDVWLRGQWVKATPVFNIELCERFRLKPLEFNGREDSIYHPFDLDGRKHMEYLNYRGTYVDLPFEEMNRDFARYYPDWGAAEKTADFEREVARETAI